ncbi:MAG: hypothetical protein ABJB09_07410 [Verrucomicrobiota bacterium]
MSTSKTLILLSALLLAFSLIFGVFNFTKARGLRVVADQGEAARQEAQQLRLARDKDLKTNAKPGNTITKGANADAESAKSKAEKDELQAKLKANETEIAQLQQRLADAVTKAAAAPNESAASTAVLQNELEETKKRLDAAEGEKEFLADKLKGTPERPAVAETKKERRNPSHGNPALRGSVLAVNQAYNFVVLNMGGRQGVEANAEMLVLRGGALIGKIRISSVEPATAIGDIVTSSLARGVQVQPGDIVIYAGTGS